jgi:nucleoside-diphosphate-sugar epimerase
MNILLTAAASPIAQALVAGLSADHTIRLTERSSVPDLPQLAVSSLNHDFSTNLLVRGQDAIIHVAEPLPSDNDVTQLDYLTRGTYNLCRAAVEEGVSRLIYLSTLELMTPYAPSYVVSERWRPRPSTAPTLLAKHLGEMVCREFAREGKLAVTVLRLGTLTADDAETTSTALSTADLTQAVTQALHAETGNWAVFHIQHAGPNARFSTALAKRQLGYTPTFAQA